MFSAARLNFRALCLRGYSLPSSQCGRCIIGMKSTTRQSSQSSTIKRNNDGQDDDTERPPDLTAKGKLITTPSRLFKLIVPLSTSGASLKDIEPIAILVHPQQPLSHLERLVQSELPLIKGDNGHSKLPPVSFTTPRQDDTAVRPRQVAHDGTDTEHGDGGERQKAREESENQPFVRWAQSTEIDDFVRDASLAREFTMTIESDSIQQIRVAVPSFNERTYFLRMRLRKVSRRIQSIAEVKNDCDMLAHRGAQRVAIGGFGVLSSWWYFVYRVTFETDLGWETMEPVTYLVSLSTLMGGYLWFLYHNREISYRSALDFTISARQNKLYQLKGVDLALWASLVDEGNALRKEIKHIAAEYDTDWDERRDEQDERVTEALKKERHHKSDNHRSKKESD